MQAMEILCCLFAKIFNTLLELKNSEGEASDLNRLSISSFDSYYRPVLLLL